jgi:hypothetical protein
MATYKQRIASLKARYPYQFARLIAYGLAVDPGWLTIFESVCEQIDTAIKRAGARKENFSWRQVKEKLGGACFYWNRSWRVPEAPRSLADDEPEFIFPESMPEDPEANQYETVEAYLTSPRAAEWDRLHMIPNPALANVKREPRRHFDRLLSVEFEEGVSEDEMDLVALAISTAVMVPEEVTLRIRTIIEGAEEEASRTCQFCGLPGTRKHLEDGWIVCGCEQHSTRESIREFNKQFESERVK